MANVMLLGGARETGLAAAALQDAGHCVRVYWARNMADPGLPACATLRAGLGWADGLVDTTHVFDRDTRSVARLLAPDMRACRHGRPLWQATAGDRWAQVPDLPHALAALTSGARVFAATGRDSAEVLAHHDGPVFLRQLHRHDDTPPANCTFVFGAGPFDEGEEARLLTDLRIDVVLARNIGGAGSYPKVAAARALGLPVILLEPAAWEFGPPLTDVRAVVTWAADL